MHLVSLTHARGTKAGVGCSQHSVISTWLPLSALTTSSATVIRSACDFFFLGDQHGPRAEEKVCVSLSLDERLRMMKDSTSCFGGPLPVFVAAEATATTTDDRGRPRSSRTLPGDEDEHSADGDESVFQGGHGEDGELSFILERQHSQQPPTPRRPTGVPLKTWAQVNLIINSAIGLDPGLL